RSKRDWSSDVCSSDLVENCICSLALAGSAGAVSTYWLTSLEFWCGSSPSSVMTNMPMTVKTGTLTAARANRTRASRDNLYVEAMKKSFYLVVPVRWHKRGDQNR